jgi:amino acid transporter
MALAYLHAFGLEGLRAAQAPAADLMRLAAGEGGAIVLALTVCCAALSTLNATIFTGARVYYALGQDFRCCGRWASGTRAGATRSTDPGAGGDRAALVALGAATRDGFQAMVDYTAPVFWFFMLLVGVALFILRRREPGRRLPFRVPLFPLTPILFCLTCAYLLYSSLAYTGFGALVGIAVLLAGLPLLWASRTPRETAPAE